MRIGARLGAVFGSLIIVVAAVGWLGVDRLATQKESIDKVAGPRWEESEQAVEGMSQIGAEMGLVAEVFLAADVAAARAAVAKADGADREGDAFAETLYA